MEIKPILDKVFSILSFFMALYVTYICCKQDPALPDDLEQTSPEDAHGIIFGRKGNKVVFSPFSAEGNCFVAASTGSGKTSSLLIPTIKSLASSNANATSFTIDISGDITSNCDIPNKRIINLSTAEGIYDVFGPIDKLKSKHEIEEALSDLALLIIPDPMGNASDAALYYAANARNLFTGALIALYDKEHDFCDICSKIGSLPYNQLIDKIRASGNETAIRCINGFLDANPANTAGCYQAMQEKILLFENNQTIRSVLRRPKKNEVGTTPADIEEKNIFLIVNESKLELYSTFLRLVTNQLLQYITDRKVTQDSSTILLSLDEYASLGIPASQILIALRRFRKRRCRILMLTQSITDLDLLYGQHDFTVSILTNTKYKALLGGLNDPESRKYFAELIGRRTTKHKTYSKSGKKTTVSESEVSEYIIPPDELDKQGKDTAILIGSDYHLLLEKNYFFKYYK